METGNLSVLTEVKGIINRNQSEACSFHCGSHYVVVDRSECESCRTITGEAVRKLKADLLERLVCLREYIPLLICRDEILSEFFVDFYTRCREQQYRTGSRKAAYSAKK